MPPKRIQVQPARRQQKSSGYLGSAYDALTSEDNRSVVISLAMFGVSPSSAVDEIPMTWICAFAWSGYSANSPDRLR